MSPTKKILNVVLFLLASTPVLAVDFGTVAYSPILTNKVEFTNTGTTDVVITRILLLDSNRVFSFLEDETQFVTNGSTCESPAEGEVSTCYATDTSYLWGTYCGDPSTVSATSPVTVAAGTTCFVAVSFMPRASTTYTARVKFFDSTNGTISTKFLAGAGTPAETCNTEANDVVAPADDSSSEGGSSEGSSSSETQEEPIEESSDTANGLTP